MQQTKRILEERSTEIDSYFCYISSVENNTDMTVYKILKANILLMLYNCIEAVVSSSVDAIRNNIHKDSSVDFNCLKTEIKKQIIKDLKQNISPEDFIRLCTEISRDVIKLSFKKENISKGNIDREVISSLAMVYGFNIKNSNYEETAHGNTLEIIKDKRNDLAHGLFSFAEIGKDYSTTELGKLKDQTIKYLVFVVGEIELYLSNKLYIHN